MVPPVVTTATGSRSWDMPHDCRSWDGWQLTCYMICRLRARSDPTEKSNGFRTAVRRTHPTVAGARATPRGHAGDPEAAVQVRAPAVQAGYGSHHGGMHRQTGAEREPGILR